MARFKHCFGCGAPTERAWVEGRERDRCSGCGRVLYDNAKPCAGVLVEQDGRVLLTKRAIEPFFGCWDIPGGFLEAEEHPEAGACREVREETGLEVALTGLSGIYMDVYAPSADPSHSHHSLNLYYTGRVIGGTLATSAESSEVRWFAPEELPPWEAIAYENGRAALRDWLLRQGRGPRGAES